MAFSALSSANAYWRFWQETLSFPQAQTWGNDNDLLYKNNDYAIRFFAKLKPGKLEYSVVFFPPHAGRHGNVTKKLVQMFRSCGANVFLLEILPAHYGSRFDLRGLIEAGKDCYRQAEGPIILAGICQGLWLSLLVANESCPPLAYFGFAGPADFHAGNGLIKRSCSQLPPAYFQFISLACCGIQPGWLQWLCFSAINPQAVFYGDYAKLWEHCADGREDKIKRWRSNHDWYWSPQNLGPWYFQASQLFFQDNRLKEMLNLKKMNWPIFLYAGGRDAITPPEQTFAIADDWGLKAVKRLFPDCGHTNVFNDSEPLYQAQKDLISILDY